MKIALGILGVIVILGVAIPGLAYLGLDFWSPRFQNVERKVFKQTDSFIQGKITYLNRMQAQYVLATPDQKQSLRALILEEASAVNRYDLPETLRGFLKELDEAK